MTNNFGGIISKEDYQEPRCVVCDINEKPNSQNIKSIPLMRIREKLDEYMSRKDYTSAERHLKYWLSEAEYYRDERGKLGVLNEMMGFYRKTSKKEEALDSARKALSLLAELEMTENITGGTTYVNAATVCDAFGLYERSADLFEKAKVVYESTLSPSDDRLGALYNNMALAYIALKRYGEAYSLYEKALVIMGQNKDGELESAITYLNMANAVEDEHGLENSEKKIEQYVEKAWSLLNTETVPKDGYYAFVCEKCAGTFEYYGYFLYANELNRRAGEIYERP